jgi:hypothetical protein
MSLWLAAARRRLLSRATQVLQLRQSFFFSRFASSFDKARLSGRPQNAQTHSSESALVGMFINDSLSFHLGGTDVRY